MKNKLLTLQNIGSATYNDLQILGINSIHELSKANPDDLYKRIQEITQRKHDPCV